MTRRILPVFLAAVLIIGGRAVPALAQNAWPVSFKPFFVVTAEGFAAEKTFDAIFGEDREYLTRIVAPCADRRNIGRTYMRFDTDAQPFQRRDRCIPLGAG